MKKILLTFLSLVFLYAVDAQCVTNAFLSADTIDCGDSVNVVINSYAASLVDECFDFNGTTSSGWAETNGAIYTNPYIPSPVNPSCPPGDLTYFWMGATAVLPARLVTDTFDVSFGGQICFDFVYAVQGGAAPTEGPDLSEEGITLQYSIDNGITWIDIQYMMPNGEFLISNPGPNFPMTNPPFSSTGTPFTTWNTVCLPFPPGALTSSTSFQWIQEFNSGACCDHWGLDNIQILAADPAYGLFDEAGGFLPSNQLTYFPTADTTINFLYTNGVNDSCYTSATIALNPTDAGPDIQVACDGLGTQFAATGVAPWATVTWSPAAGVSDVNDPNSFVQPMQDTEYTLTSDCGVDVINVYVEDAFVINITPPDTICLNGSTFLNLATTPTSVPIASVEWNNAQSLNSSTGNQVLASPLATTTYVATVTSDSGCVIQDTVVVNVQGVAATISVVPENPRICSGSSVVLSANINTPAVPYTLVQGPYNPYPTTGGTNVTGLLDENFLGPIPVGFVFPFFGNSYNQLYVGSNGWISFSPPSGSFLGNATIPATAQPNNLIAWGWDDLDFSAGGTFNYYVGGTAPNQYMVMNFLNVNYWLSPLSISVQVVIYQNGLIEINNINVVPEFAGSTMTQGIENATGTQGLSDPAINNTSITSAGENWSFVPFTAPANPVYTWTPPTNLSTTNGPVTTASPNATTEYFVTMVDGFCSSTTSVTVGVDSLYATSITNDILLECPEDSIQLNITAATTIFNDLSCGGPAGLCDGPAVTNQVGTGTASTTATGNTPFGWFYANGRRQILYTAAELNAMGFNGGNLYSIAFNITQKNSSTPIPQFAIGLKCVPNTLTSISNISQTGFTDVYTSPAYTTATGWNTFNFSTPYVWDGVSNLLVQVCFGTGTTPWGSNDQVQISNTTSNQFAWGFQDNTGTPGCSTTTFTTGTGSVSSKPNARFNYCNVTPGFAPITYSWSTSPSLTLDDDTINNPLILDEVTQNTFAIVQLNDGTCASADTVQITFGAGYTVTADTAICIGESVQLLVTGGTNHVWTPNDGSLSSTTIPNPLATPVANTTYIVNLDLTNCSVADTVEIAVNSLPVSLINNGASDAVVCDGTDVDLVSDADAAWTNTWVGPEQGSGTAINVSTQGFYVLTSTDANGCESSSTIQVSFNDNPVLDPNVVRNILCCTDDEVIITFQDLVTNGITLDENFWDNGANPAGTSVTVSSGEDGTYNVQVFSVDGCEGNTQLTFETNCINPNIVEQDSIVFGGTTPYEFTADETTDSEVWTPSFTSNTFTANTVSNDFETIVLAATASYTLNDGSTRECTEVDSSQIFVFLIVDPELPDAFTPNGDGLNDKFFPVNMDPNSSITAFRVYNRWGELVYDFNNDNGWDGKWNGSDQPGDVYNYYLMIDKTTETFVTSGDVTLIR